MIKMFTSYDSEEKLLLPPITIFKYNKILFDKKYIYYSQFILFNISLPYLYIKM